MLSADKLSKWCYDIVWQWRCFTSDSASFALTLCALYKFIYSLTYSLWWPLLPLLEVWDGSIYVPLLFIFHSLVLYTLQSAAFQLVVRARGSLLQKIVSSTIHSLSSWNLSMDLSQVCVYWNKIQNACTSTLTLTVLAKRFCTWTGELSYISSFIHMQRQREKCVWYCIMNCGAMHYQYQYWNFCFMLFQEIKLSIC